MKTIFTTVFSDGPGGGNPAPVFVEADMMTEQEMQKAAADLDFAEAARLRDEMWALQEYLKVWKD